jgi:hypothetical protein
MFFAETQNKLLFAVTGKTAAEIIVNRAAADKKNMGLTSWKGAIVRKQDILIAKNYLTEDEIDTLNRLVVIFLETAELTVKERKELTMKFWNENIDNLLQFQKRKILSGSGSLSKLEMEEFATKIYEDFNQKRKEYDAQLADEKDIEEIKEIEIRLRKRQKK